MNVAIASPSPPAPRPRVQVTVPVDRHATEPPELRGRARDEVRLLVAESARIRHLWFRQLADVLAPGDLVVVNTSATIHAAIDARRRDGSPVVVHVAGPTEDGRHVVELRRPDGAGPVLDARPGEEITLVTGVRLRLDAPRVPDAGRLWVATVGFDEPFEEHLAVHGRPIAYGDSRRGLPLSAYQPAVARHPGSAEMASAGRPLTPRVVTDLVARGVAVAPVLLHAGVSSLVVGEVPPAERYEVPAVTSRLVAHTRRHGGRIVAVGTTVTRALETVAAADGRVRPGRGWTDLVLGPDRPARVVDGLVTGWHEPEASHLLLLEAVAGADLVQRAYEAAVAGPYRWHEFGDSCLLLPDR
jgi:S-adenosylmethionine:tRNA ribosyltransferase-isomerase